MAGWQQPDPRQRPPQTPSQWRGQAPPPASKPPMSSLPPTAWESQAYPPPQYQQQPPVQVNVQQNAYGPRRAVTQGKLGYGEELFHWMMIICTCGLWYPVYASRRRSKRSVTRYR